VLGFKTQSIAETLCIMAPSLEAKQSLVAGDGSEREQSHLDV
jgi:hypothetical protein